MRIEVVTLFPEMFEAVTAHGVTGRAISGGIVRVGMWNPRDYTYDVHRTVDDRPFGGGPGMIMCVQPLREAIRAARRADDTEAHVVYLTPQGRRLEQRDLWRLAALPRLILVAGRYEGVDERVVESEVDEECSIGDYVLSGGELPAMVLMDGLMRLVPGVLGDENSARTDSFDAGLLDCPHYTRPAELPGQRVPAVLLSGDHDAIRRWRLKQSLGRTWRRRPDLLRTVKMDREQRRLLDEYIEEYGGDTDLELSETGASHE